MDMHSHGFFRWNFPVGPLAGRRLRNRLLGFGPSGGLGGGHVSKMTW